MKKLEVFEKRLRTGDIPAEQIPRLLPEADVVTLSGTTLINHNRSHPPGAHETFLQGILLYTTVIVTTFA
ncbi:MAG: hypothetical protein AMS17_18110 [Spirochaetes bacterium DG_61]|nr:MAG: hypothetical protein AMS17_18110 [Spirochaetes bacterium DG_61]